VGSELFYFLGSEEFLTGFSPLGPETSIGQRGPHHLGEEEYTAYNQGHNPEPYLISLTVPPSYHLISS